MGTLLRLALRNLTRQRRRTALVLAALALGVLAIVGVRGFLNGLQGQLTGGFTEGQIGALQVHATGFLKSLDAAPLSPSMALDDGALLGRIEAVEGVKAAAPRIATPAMVSVGDGTSFALVVAVDPERELRCCRRRTDVIIDGAWMKPGDPRWGLMGTEMLRGLGGKPGASAVLLGGDVDGVMNAVEIDVRARLAAPTQGEKKLVLLPLATGQELVRMPGRATEIAVAVHDLAKVDEVAARVRAALGPAYEVHTWKQLAPFAHDVVETQDRVLNIVTTTFLVVILMGVANALLTSVLERVREIGTMMAIGGRRRQILTLFVMEALMLGVLGAAIGAAIGAALVTALGHFGVVLTTPGATLPQRIEPFIHVAFLLRMVVLCALGAALASLWPAMKASRLRPVEALAGGGAA